MAELNVYQRMHAVMKAVGYVQKEDKKVNNQYTFVSHDAVTAKIRPALIEHGILCVPKVTKRMQDGNRTEVDMDIDFVNVDKPDEKITVSMFGYGIDPQDKGPGKAVSYAVKYALLKAFALETGDDPERDQIEHKPAPKAGVISPVKETLKTVDMDSVDQGKVAKVVSAMLDMHAEETSGTLLADWDWAYVETWDTLSNDEKVVGWDMLKKDSKVRSRITKAKEAIKAREPKAAE